MICAQYGLLLIKGFYKEPLKVLSDGLITEDALSILNYLREYRVVSSVTGRYKELLVMDFTFTKAVLGNETNKAIIFTIITETSATQVCKLEPDLKF